MRYYGPWRVDHRIYSSADLRICCFEQCSGPGYDRFFSRTCRRSLVLKKVPLYHALILSFILIVAGLIGLWWIGGAVPALIGILGLFVYNLIYTPLKKRSLLAVFPERCAAWLRP